MRAAPIRVATVQLPGSEALAFICRPEWTFAHQFQQRKGFARESA